MDVRAANLLRRSRHPMLRVTTAVLFAAQALLSFGAARPCTHAAPPSESASAMSTHGAAHAVHPVDDPSPSAPSHGTHGGACRCIGMCHSAVFGAVLPSPAIVRVAYAVVPRTTLPVPRPAFPSPLHQRGVLPLALAPPTASPA
jgi:hypothetical protein